MLSVEDECQMKVLDLRRLGRLRGGGAWVLFVRLRWIDHNGRRALGGSLPAYEVIKPCCGRAQRSVRDQVQQMRCEDRVLHGALEQSMDGS